jgi:hypothetical protein
MSQEQTVVTTPNQVAEANLFDIRGPIVINYSATSIAGVPLFSYKDAERDLQFRGDEVARMDTPLGELVTVTLENVVDAFVRTFTLLVPKIRLSMGAQVDFDTLGIVTTDRSGAFVPPPGPTGVLQTYSLHQLRGVAQAVIP